MHLSTKCSSALHLLLLLSVFKDKKLTSTTLAQSIGCNPVMVRNLLGSLKKADIVEVHRGIGGATLVADPEDITLLQVYQTVDPLALEKTIGVHQNFSTECPIGKNIAVLLEKPFSLIVDSMKDAMSKYTLKQLIDEYYSLDANNIQTDVLQPKKNP